MDEKQLIESFRDDVGLAIEAATAVEPRPELKVLVRARVDRERAAPPRWISWQLASVGTLLVVIAAIALVRWQVAVDRTVSTPQIAAAHISAAAEYVSAARPSPPRIDAPVRRAQTTTRTMSNEADALRAYMAYLRKSQLDSSALATRPAGKPVDVAKITIERIAIEPLPKLEAVLGDRQ